MKKTIAIIAATVAAFSLNAASCEQLAPTPAVEQIVTFEDAPSPCGFIGTDSFGGCVMPEPDATPTVPQDCDHGGFCDPAPEGFKP